MWRLAAVRAFFSRAPAQHCAQILSVLWVRQTQDSVHGDTSLRGGCQRRVRGDFEPTTGSSRFGQASKMEQRRAHPAGALCRTT